MLDKDFKIPGTIAEACFIKYKSLALIQVNSNKWRIVNNDTGETMYTGLKPEAEYLYNKYQMI